jgi:2,4-dienoyl-CoA reductase-like NADH-dependent reductase (Old Yellow Enzyme family)
LGAASTTAAGLIANVGSTDAIVTYTLASATTGAGTIVVAYVVRNSDGSAYPSATQN